MMDDFKKEINIKISEILRYHKDAKTRKNKIFNFLIENSVVFRYFKRTDTKNTGFIIYRSEKRRLGKECTSQ